MATMELTHPRGDSGTARSAGAPVPAAARAGDLRSVLEQVERDLITSALLESRGNKAKAARALGITERLMGIRVARLGIDWRGLRTVRTGVRTYCRVRPGGRDAGQGGG